MQSAWQADDATEGEASTRALTARLWLATHGDVPLVLPPGLYGTDGWKLWKLNGEEEAPEAQEAIEGLEAPAQATEAPRQVTRDPRIGDEGALGLGLHGRGNGCDERTGQRSDGVRPVRKSSGRGRADPEYSEHRVPLQEMRQLQRVAGLKQRVEGAENVEHGRADKGQHLHNWCSVAQGWEAGDLALHIHLTLGAEDGHEGGLQEWCADLQCATAFDELVESSERPVRDDLKVDPVQTDDGGYQYTMLVRAREVSEPSERFRLIPGSVRLVPADDCPVLARNAWEAAAELVAKRLARGRHWELDAGGVLGLGVRSELHKSPCEVVEGGSEVLDGVSKSKSVVGSDVRDAGYSDYGDVPVRGFEVDIEGNGVSVRVGSRFERRCYGLHVLTRPTELLPGAVHSLARHGASLRGADA